MQWYVELSEYMLCKALDLGAFDVLTNLYKNFQLLTHIGNKF